MSKKALLRSMGIRSRTKEGSIREINQKDLLYKLLGEHRIPEPRKKVLVTVFSSTIQFGNLNAKLLARVITYMENKQYNSEEDIVPLTEEDKREINEVLGVYCNSDRQRDDWAFCATGFVAEFKSYMIYVYKTKLENEISQKDDTNQY